MPATKKRTPAKRSGKPKPPSPMSVRFNREALLSAFKIVSAITPSRSPKPILQCVKLEASASGVLLSTTDLEVGGRLIVPAEVESPGAVLCDGKRFALALERSRGEFVTVSAGEGDMHLSGDSFRIALESEYSPTEFPQVHEFNSKAYCRISADALQGLIERTVFATDNESSRYALGGVKIELEKYRLTAVGTDGRRLSCAEVPIEHVGKAPAGDKIIPARAMQYMREMLSGEVRIAFQDNLVLATDGNATVSAKCLDGKFPAWRDVIPSKDCIAIGMNVERLSESLSLAKVATSEESRAVDFTFGSGKLTLAGHTYGLGKSLVELPAPYDGPDINTLLDPRYVLEFLAAVGSSDVTVDMRGPKDPAVWRTEGYTYVVMPLERA
jgi:DNA polymerase III subunit beta